MRKAIAENTLKKLRASLSHAKVTYELTDDNIVFCIRNPALRKAYYYKIYNDVIINDLHNGKSSSELFIDIYLAYKKYIRDYILL